MSADKMKTLIPQNALRRRREELGRLENQRITQEDIAARSGEALSQRTVSHLEAGTIDLGSLSMGRVTALARALKWSLAEIQAATGFDLGLHPNHEGFEREKGVTLEYINSSVITMKDIYDFTEAAKPPEQMTAIPDLSPTPVLTTELRPATALFRVSGDGMVGGEGGGIQPGDIIYVDTADLSPEDDGVYLAHVYGKPVTLHRLRELGGTLWLFSDNADQSAYPPIPLSGAKLLGRVHDVKRDPPVRLGRRGSN